MLSKFVLFTGSLASGFFIFGIHAMFQVEIRSVMAFAALMTIILVFLYASENSFLTLLAGFIEWALVALYYRSQSGMQVDTLNIFLISLMVVMVCILLFTIVESVAENKITDCEFNNFIKKGQLCFIFVLVWAMIFF